ncbi:TetR/AcrR family transcriptional regulator [Miltoncostaea marina]|uniref:TetR/AcrR family transcriptional regulator n=1 Tax=Miltoncostaea marina TaxID=2843215 RepID=UPI001C3C5949|nr:TetR/AcrR family transcriptional regulator [Miltoncostaea marina]
MPPRATPSPSPRRPRRADAERSVAAILDAALEGLAGDPDVSMAEIARRAGVSRATTYVHFPTREALVTAVTERAIADVAAILATADPAAGDAADALRRVLRAAWRELDRFHALVAINARLPREEFHRLHVPVLTHLAPLIARGQQEGAFRADVPVAWHLSMLLAIVHAASGELRAGRVAADDVEGVMVATVLGAVGAHATA